MKVTVKWYLFPAYTKMTDETAAGRMVIQPLYYRLILNRRQEISVAACCSYFLWANVPVNAIKLYLCYGSERLEKRSICLYVRHNGVGVSAGMD
jgi:hypothetical protein